jgi:hypothetical protein
MMTIEEGKYKQAKGIQNIFNKIIARNIPNLVIQMVIQVQDA